MGTLVAALTVFLCSVSRKRFPRDIPCDSPIRKIPRDFLHGEATRKVLEKISLSLATGGPGLGMMLSAGAGGLAYRGYVVQNLAIIPPENKELN